jgi:replication-associated recombination protein RarA
MKSEGYSEGYLYDHDQPDAFSGQDYFPEAMGRKTFYDPPERGFERDHSQASGILVQAQKRTIDKGIGHEQHHP